ncbi:MAG: thioredoxin domain-containing protein, partial [Phycisphaerales bacterium]
PSLDPGMLDRAADALRSFEDRIHGGFGGAPKFPQPVYLRLLEEASSSRPALASAIDRALEAMALGGIFDHAGGGFHRYAVDATWTVPHFEKMLYDNGQLAKALAASLRRRPDALLARTLRRTLEWMLREMHIGQGFAAALDAETEAREGRSYLWTPEEVRAALSEAGLGELVDWTLETYGLAGEANFRDPHHPDEPPSWVLRLAETPAKLADRCGVSIDDFFDRQDRAESALLAARDRRLQPARDDKVLAGWNGLAIGGLARGGEALGEQGDRFVDAAIEAARSLLSALLIDDGRRLLRTPDGIPGLLEDHALLAEGLLDLASVLETREPEESRRMLAAAVRLAEIASARFGDPSGGWFDTEAGKSDLFVRAKRLDDGAVPSGAGTMILVELELAARTRNGLHLDRAAAALVRGGATIASNPVGAALGTIGSARLARIAPDRLAPASAPPRRPVQASLHPAVPTFGPDGRAEATLRLQIESPHHINAHDPGEDGLVGLAIGSVSEGFAVEASYPDGELYRERLRVHAREVEIPLRLRRSAHAPPVCRISVRVQPCTDRHCLPPISLEVPVP